MASIFNKTNSLYENPKRNTMNVSRQNNLTFNFGQLIPCSVQEVLPGDTAMIDTTIGLKSLPFLFPVQTRMRAHIHHFYVRNRTLWKDWQDFITMSKDNLVPPYISPSKHSSFYKTGTLSDYLGLPTTYYGPSDVVAQQRVITAKKQNLRVVGNIVSYNIGDDVRSRIPAMLFDDRITAACQNYQNYDFASLMSDVRASWLNKQDTFTFQDNLLQAKSRLPITDLPLVPTDKELVSVLSNEFRFTLNVGDLAEETRVYSAIYCDGLLYDKTKNDTRIYLLDNHRYYSSLSNGYLFSIRYKDGYVESFSKVEDYLVLSDFIDNVEIHGEIVDVMQFFSTTIEYFIHSDRMPYIYDGETEYKYFFPNESSDYLSIAYATSDVDRVLDGNDINHPYGDAIRISALPYRAYEMIYNSFYRDSRNNPRYVNGQPEYNKFLTTDEGGEDNTNYQIFYHHRL